MSNVAKVKVITRAKAITYLIDVLGYDKEVYDWDMIDLMEAIDVSHKAHAEFVAWCK